MLEIVDLLTSLTEKSLVVVGERDGHSRYRLLETVRHYALEKLMASGCESVIRQRYLDYFLALAEEAEPKLTGSEEAEWMGRLDEENENVRDALAWSLAQVDSAKALALCGALSWFCAKRGYFD